MTAEIFRPPGLYLVTNSQDNGLKRVSVHYFGIGQMTFPWREGEEAIITAVEVHGKTIALHLPIESISNDRAIIKWDNWGFNFTLLNQWIGGLSLDEREVVISDVLDWQQEASEKAYSTHIPENKKAA